VEEALENSPLGDCDNIAIGGINAAHLGGSDGRVAVTGSDYALGETGAGDIRVGSGGGAIRGWSVATRFSIARMDIKDLPLSNGNKVSISGLDAADLGGSN
jgi:hypothetical protein